MSLLQERWIELFRKPPQEVTWEDLTELIELRRRLYDGYGSDEAPVDCQWQDMQQGSA